MGMRGRRLGMLLRLGLLCCLAAALSGCGVLPWFGREQDPRPPSPLPPFADEVRLHTLWSIQPTRGTEGRQLRLVAALSGDRLYVADARGRVAAIDAPSGRELWRQETGLALSAGPEVAGGRLLLGTAQGEVLALAEQDGRTLWRTSLGSEILSPPKAADGRVIVHALDDSIYALDAASGQVQWRAHYPPPVLTLRGSSAPLIAPGGAVVGLSGGKLVKLGLEDGAPIWETLVTRPSGRSELARVADIDADPILIGETLYVGTYNGDLAGVALDRGEVLWRRKLSTHAGLAADDTGLYVTDSEDQVWGAELQDGAGRWKQDQLRYRRLTAPVILGGYLLVGDLEGYLHLLDKRDGRLVGRARPARGRISAPPVVFGRRIYVYGEDGTLTALEQP